VTIRSFVTEEAPDGLFSEVRPLVFGAFDGRFTDEDWEHTLGGRHVVVFDEGLCVAHAAVVPRTLCVAGAPFDCGYVEGVATAPEKQGRGFGSLAMTEISRFIRSEYEFGALSTDRHSFYERLGWERWSGPTYVRTGTDEVRTEEEDAGIMVLRFGPSGGIDLAAALSCEARRGDDW